MTMYETKIMERLKVLDDRRNADNDRLEIGCNTTVYFIELLVGCNVIVYLLVMNGI